MILVQRDTVIFQIIEEAKTKANSYRNARIAWTKLPINVYLTTGAYKTRLSKNLAKCVLYYKLRNLEEHITELKIVRGD